MKRFSKGSFVLALLVLCQGTIRPDNAVTKFYKKHKKAINAAVVTVTAAGIAIGAALLAKKAYDVTSDIKDPQERLFAVPVIAVLAPLGMERATKALVALVDRDAFTTDEMVSFVMSDTGAALAKNWGKTHAEFITYAAGLGLRAAGRRIIEDIKGFFNRLQSELGSR